MQTIPFRNKDLYQYWKKEIELPPNKHLDPDLRLKQNKRQSRRKHETFLCSSASADCQRQSLLHYWPPALKISLVKVTSWHSLTSLSPSNNITKDANDMSVVMPGVTRNSIQNKNILLNRSIYKHCIKNWTVSKHNYEFTVCPLISKRLPLYPASIDRASAARVRRRGPAVHSLYCDLSPKLPEDTG